MNKTSTILQPSTAVMGRRNSITQPAQSPVRCVQFADTSQLQLSRQIKLLK